MRGAPRRTQKPVGLPADRASVSAMLLSRPLQLLLALAATAVAAPRAAAQGAAMPALRAEPFVGVQVDPGMTPGAIWARGPAWKACFDSREVRFVPVFGAANPRSHRFAMRLSAAGGPISPSSVGTTVSYARAGVVERYECGPAGLEQSFVVGDRASAHASGVVLELDTDLEFAGRRDGLGLVFVAPGFGEVRYGMATAIDADGRRVEFAPRFDAGRITLAVPPGFLASARFPLTIDPLISTFAISTTSFDDTAPDVAYDATTDTWLVVYRELASGSDGDVKVRRFDGNGTQLEVSYAEATGADAASPKVANNGDADQFLIVWPQADGLFSGSIRARSHAAGSSSFGVAVEIVAGAQPGRVPGGPVVGGSSVAGADRYLVAWIMFRTTPTPTSLVQSCTVSTAGALGTTRTLASSASPSDLAINRTARDAANWLVAWTHRALSAFAPGDIRAVVLNGSGAIALGETELEGQVGDDVRPAVAGDGNEFLVLWEQEQGALSDNYDIRAAIVRQNAAGVFARVGNTVNLSNAEPGVNTALNQTDASIDFDGVRYAYAYSESGTTVRPFGATLLVVGNVIDHQAGHEALTGTGANCSSTNLASRGGAGGPAGTFLAVWQQIASNGSGLRNVFGAFYEARASSGGISFLTASCRVRSANPSLLVSPAPSIGLPMSVDLLAVQGTPLLLVGTQQAPIPLCSTITGNCQLLVSPISSIAGSRFTALVPAETGLLGARLAFQGLDLGSGNACPSNLFGLAFATSDAAIVTLQ